MLETMLSRVLLIFGIGFGILLTGFLIRLKFLATQSQYHKRFPLGIVNGELQKCPKTPNCYRAEKLWRGSKEEGIEAVERVIKEMGGEVRERASGYLRAIFITRLFGFVDDFEVQVLKDRVRIRSSSRVGYSDMGINRQRVETFIKNLK